MKEIYKRTCCRIFDSSKTVSKEEIQKIMKAGQAAPSAKNRQPYFFVAILNKECKAEISMATARGREKQFAHFSMEEFKKIETGKTGSNDISISNSSAAILVFRDSDTEYTEAEPESLNIKEEQGVAAAAYSMMLEAHSMGIASGWICSPIYIKDLLKEILTKYGVKFNDNWEPRLIIPLGYASLTTNKPLRKPLEEKCAFVE